MRLDKDLTLVRRETTGNEYKGSLNRSLFEFFDGIIHGNGMVVHHAEYTVIIFGKLNPIPYGAHVVAQVYFTSGLYPAENPFHSFLHAMSLSGGQILSSVLPDRQTC